MDETITSFVEWVKGLSFEGAPATVVNDRLIRFSAGLATATVTLLDLEDEQLACKLTIVREGEREACFRTCFVLDDRWRSRKLVHEMLETLSTIKRLGVARVAVCSSRGLPAPSFTRDLREASKHHAVAYEFIERDAMHTLNDRNAYTAILLTPQVAHLRKVMVRTHPQACVMAIPSRVFAEGDARSAFRLMLEALCEVDVPEFDLDCTTATRPLARPGTVLVLNVMYHDRCVRVGYRVYRDGVVVVRSTLTKSRLEMADIDDLLRTLPLSGVSVSELDAISFVMPGVVNWCSMNLPSLGDRDVSLAERIEQHFGVPVFMDNSTNTAAMGCYLTDTEHESLTLYRHQLGHHNGGQGSVIDGNLICGRYNLAGEPKFYQRRFSYPKGYRDSTWTDSGLEQICLNVMLASFATISPDVFYVAVAALEDLDEIVRALERTLPKYCTPDVVKIDDYRDLMYLGAVGLALARLKERAE